MFDSRLVTRGRDVDHPNICKCSILWDCEEGGDRRHTLLKTLFNRFFFDRLDTNGESVQIGKSKNISDSFCAVPNLSIEMT